MYAAEALDYRDVKMRTLTNEAVFPPKPRVY